VAEKDKGHLIGFAMRGEHVILGTVIMGVSMLALMLLDGGLLDMESIGGRFPTLSQYLEKMEAIRFVVYALMAFSIANIAYGLLASEQAKVIIKEGKEVLIKCPYCNALNMENAFFCSVCGSKIGAVPAVKGMLVKCASCNAFNPADSSFCRKCGHKMRPIRTGEK
jgi:ribosomal protein L40E